MPPGCTAWAVRFHDALAFLTRLVPPRAGGTGADFAAATCCFAPVGLLLGGVLTLAAWLAHRATAYAPFDGALAAALSGWVWLALDIWATRGLHWDGLADLGDAAGSGASGEGFRNILRDSRLGAFGALHLLLAFSGQWLAVAGHAAAERWLLLLLAPAWGRAAAVWLAAWTPAREDSALGRLTCEGTGPRLGRAYLALGAGMLALPACLGLCPLRQLLLAGFVQFALTRRLHCMALAQGGLSGDFLGACIQWSQLCFLLCTL